MFNFLDDIIADPGFYRQLRYDDELVTEYNCPIGEKLQDLWSHQSYFVFVLDGRKVWHTADGAVDLHAGEAAFVRKGAGIVEQDFARPFCVVIFFVSDEFICETVRSMGPMERRPPQHTPAMVRLNKGAVLDGFVQSMLPHFRQGLPVHPELLRLKFRELLLAVMADAGNAQLLSYFCSLLHDPVHERVRRVMEDNYRFNLQLEDFARLSGRSLSAFKRDFQEIYGMPPGRWLRDRRLERARTMLRAGDLQVSEVAFQCGFENLSHFSRAFKEHFGHAPAALREAKA
ncbi:MAG: helix-turn-helix transcriptional regulator [Flavobacteriales bacterium]|nr:helix-turn-helix transcriptional regulator [Flavobacteriales bacterium]